MITLYFLIVAFVGGAFAGASIEGKKPASASDRVIMLVLAILWPALIYIYWKLWRAKP